MKIHELKLDDFYFDDVKYGTKRFEIRKNDRDFQAGDLLALSRFKDGEYRERTLLGERKITDIHNADTILMSVDYITDYEQKEGYVVMGISPFATDDEVDE